VVQTEDIFVFDGAKNIQILPEECAIQVQWLPATRTVLLQNDKLSETLLRSESTLGASFDGGKARSNKEKAVGEGQQPYYFYVTPAHDRNVQLLSKLRAQEVHLKDLPARLKEQGLEYNMGGEP
jgi:hypothetical protein